MAMTLDQLSNVMHQFFQDKLPGAGGATPGSVLVVLDGLGIPLTAGEFGVGGSDAQQQLFSHQRASQLADQLPAVNALKAGWYVKQQGSRLSRWYRSVVTQSVCTSAADQDKAAFEARKAAASEELDLNALPEVAGVTPAGPTVDPTGVADTLYATGMAPPNWYQPGADVWETHRITGKDTAPAVTGNPLPVPELDMHVALDPAAVNPTIAGPAAPGFTTMPLGAVTGSESMVALLPTPPGLGALIGPVGPPPKPPGFSVTFDYCIVSFDRPWWDEVFVSTGNWSVPGIGRAQIASGDGGNPAAAVSLITTGMVVIRNLAITAAWTDSDRQMLATDAASLGPFSTLDASFNDQTLTRKGMQAIAWICQVPPALPPAQ
jgi:hypothetical protein